MDLNLELLSIQNPWWRNLPARLASEALRARPDPLYQGGNLGFDPVIEQYECQVIKWRPAVLDEINLSRDNIYCLYGSKGVGKTTLLKLMIKKLIEEDKVNSNNIFFYSCHNLDSYEQLNEMIKLFLNFKAEPKARRYIFIDEIAMIKNWHKGIDYLIKGSKLTKAAVVLSASSFSKTKDVAGIKNIVINNLDFSEFASLINPEIFKGINYENYLRRHGQLEYYLDIYFLTGGFISAINDYKENGAVRQSVYSNYLHWFLAYVARSNRDIVLTRQIMEKLILSLGSPVGYKTLTHKTKAKTHLTAAEYLNILEAMFAVKTVYQSEDGEPSSRKAKKVYFRDPFIFWLFYSYIHGSLNYYKLARERLHDKAVFAALVENAVLSHLIKNTATEATYWRDNVRKIEIDFLVKQGKSITPILIRYGREINEADFNILKQAGFKKGIIISKDKLENKNGISI
ncbi:ATP-binding protein, partial [Candidatus Falkowbacteria bacterium]|nr:ATP-binding protein [Candidatus Falkowbacteria bacterium]